MKVTYQKMIIGTMAGIVSGLFGSGGGLILIPAYSMLFHKSEKETRATVICCILPMVITSSIIYGFHHDIDWNITLKCGIGEVLGSLLGSKLLNTLHPKYLKLIFILFLLYASIRIIFFT